MTNDVFLQAADVVRDFRAGKGGLKALCYTHANQPGPVYALALRALGHADLLKDTISRLIKADDATLEHNHVLVMATEALLGDGIPHRRRRLEGSTRDALRVVKAHMPEFEHLLKKVDTTSMKSRDATTTTPYLPRALRVNLDKRDYPEINDEHERVRLTLEAEEQCIVRVQDQLRNELPQEAKLTRHPILKDFLLVSAPDSKIPFHNLWVVKTNQVIMQSLASGLPLAALRDAAIKLLPSLKNICVLDVCAAPGSKTFQACNYFSGVHANDLDKRRCEIILRRGKELITTKVIRSTNIIAGLPINSLVITSHDALRLKDTGCQIIVCDPTCSSSGIYANKDSSLAETAGVSKAHADPAELSQFQTKLLTRLLTKFPSAMLVSYSTCSVHPIENEDVVAAVLENETVISKEWTLWNALPEWPMRGKKPYTYCLRADKRQQTDGFFTAIFVRKSLLKKSL